MSTNPTTYLSCVHSIVFCKVLASENKNVLHWLKKTLDLYRNGTNERNVN